MINVYNRHNTNSFNPKALKAIVKASIDNGGMISVVSGKIEVIAYKEFSTYFLDLWENGYIVSTMEIHEKAVLQLIESVVNAANKIEMSGAVFYFEM